MKGKKPQTPPHHKKMQYTLFFLYTVQDDSCYLIPVISKEKGSQIYECVCTCTCMCVYICA